MDIRLIYKGTHGFDYETLDLYDWKSLDEMVEAFAPVYDDLIAGISRALRDLTDIKAPVSFQRKTTKSKLVPTFQLSFKIEEDTISLCDVQSLFRDMLGRVNAHSEMMAEMGLPKDPKVAVFEKNKWRTINLDSPSNSLHSMKVIDRIGCVDGIYEVLQCSVCHECFQRPMKMAP